MSDLSEPTNTSEDETIKLTHEALKNICVNNRTYFNTDTSEYGQRLFTAFTSIIQHVTDIEPVVLEISKIAKYYDFDEKTPGNGYRSFLTVVKACNTYCMQISSKVCLKRDNILFRKSYITREVESCNELLENLHILLQHVSTLMKWCPVGELFPNAEHSPEELLSKTTDINQFCFFGRCLGFQFCDSIRHILKFISISMAIFSESYYNNGSFLSKATSSVWTSGRYVLDPDTRARRIVNISRNADVDFCKAFWYLSESEMMLYLPLIVSSSVAVNHVISIPPEPLQYTKTDGSIINIPIPSAHIGAQHLTVRLISHIAREGMVGITGNKINLSPPSTGLLVHCHGGGFVAQSSRSHEIYLRVWAQQLGVPILSIDYSLAPGAPFPRAIEEVFYAYSWALNNCHLLGSTAQKIILAGDSAGGNLCIGAAMKCVETGMRPPDGLFLAYVPVLVCFESSPSRMLCLMDPLLPFGFMMRCLKAYACPDLNLIKNEMNTSQNGATSSDTESFEEVSESDLLELQAHKSPISETSDTLTNVSLSSQPVSSCSKPSDNTFSELKYHQKHDLNKCGPDKCTCPIENKDKCQCASQKYVSEFLEKYVLDSDESDISRVPVLESHVVSSNSKSSMEQSFQQRFVGFVGALTSRLTTWKNKNRSTPAQLFLDTERQASLMEEFKFNVPRDPYLSPYLATDDILKCLPPARILSVELDPCLDDCVMFAKRLKKLGNNVDLDVLKDLPHGFLNLSAVCKEAYQGSNVCIKRIQELLDLSSQSDCSIHNQIIADNN